MAFFDQVGQKLTRTSQEAVKKTKDMAEVVRLNNAIAEEQRKIENNYLEVGRLYYQHFADRDEEIFKPLLEQIKSCQTAVLEMRTAVRQLKGLQACPSCGNEQPIGQAFCNACGAKMPQLSEGSLHSQNEDGIRCRVCGAVMQDGMAFCMNCGTKLESEEQD